MISHKPKRDYKTTAIICEVVQNICLARESELDFVVLADSVYKERYDQLRNAFLVVI